MKCKEKGCKGEINKNNSVPLWVGCQRAPALTAYPCEECGRLHDKNGSLVFNNAGNKAFLEFNEVIFRDKNNEIIEF